MKKVFYVYLSLMMCMFASCQKDEDAAPEPQPEPEKPVVKYAEYETTDDYVDFGVGNFMIATKNLGAKRPEDTGDFFAWGETVPKDVYSWDTYKLQTSNLYYKDNGLLQPQDDAATVILGEGWRLPTANEVKLLYDMHTTDENCCRMRPAISNGVYGFMLIGPNGNSAFFPSTGRMQGNELITWDKLCEEQDAESLHDRTEWRFHLLGGRQKRGVAHTSCKRAEGSVRHRLPETERP